jgi:hypothetical protein
MFRIISIPIPLGIAQWNRRSVLAGYGAPQEQVCYLFRRQQVESRK